MRQRRLREGSGGTEKGLKDTRRGLEKGVKVQTQKRVKRCAKGGLEQGVKAQKKG